MFNARQSLREPGRVYDVGARGTIPGNASRNAYALEADARAGLRLKLMRVIEANPETSLREIASKSWVSMGGGCELGYTISCGARVRAGAKF